MEIRLPQPVVPPGMPLAGRRAAVFGLGKSGLASARFLRERGASVVAFDEAPAEQLHPTLAELADAGIAAAADVRDWDELSDPDLIVVSPGVPANHRLLEQARALGAEIIGEIELAYRFCAAPLAAVAGTNGKGSTTKLLGAMLQAAGRRAVVAGNIGIPLVSVVTEDWDLVVAEVSSFQLETIVHFRPWAAILLNITPDHLDRHGSFAAYVAAKRRLFGNQGPADLAVLNAADPVVWGLRKGLTSQVLGVGPAGSGHAGYLEGDRLMVRLPAAAPVEICRRQDLRLDGDHYVTDALCAGVVAVAAGCDPQSLAAGVRSWEPAEHLLTEVAIVKGVRFVDDSKATNPGAAIADLSTVTAPFWVIAGGVGKGLDLSSFADAVAQRARGAFLIGEATDQIATHLGDRLPVRRCTSVEEAVQQAHRVAQPGEVVILAPACASFDQFRGQADRGERFAAAVRALDA